MLEKRHTSRQAALEIVLIFSVGAILVLSLPKIMGSDPIILQFIIGTTYFICMTLIWFQLNRHGNPWTILGFHKGDKKFWQRTLIRSFIVLIIALIAFLMGGWLAMNLGLFSQAADMSGYDHLKGNFGMLLLTLLAVYLTSSLGEEVIYRGFLITNLSEIFQTFRWPNELAIFLSGIVFGLVHYNWGPMGMIQTTLMGWALGYFYVRFGRNLWITIFAHAYMDTALIIQMY